MTTSDSGGRRILLGQIMRAHGIRGEVIVKTFTGAPADIGAYGALTDADGRDPLRLSVVRASEKGAVARIAGVDDRNAAEALKGRELFVARNRLPAAREGEYYHADLIGLDVFDRRSQRIGRVVDVQNFGAGDLLEILREEGKDTDLIPFTATCVPDVDLANGRVTIEPPEMSGEPEPANDAGAADTGESGPDA